MVVMELMWEDILRLTRKVNGLDLCKTLKGHKVIRGTLDMSDHKELLVISEIEVHKEIKDHKGLKETQVLKVIKVELEV
jgi:hypothetical protein